MKERLVRESLSLGFDLCRVTSAAAPDHAAEFQRWLAAGHHGAMGYLQRNAHKRIDPQQVLPGAKSIIVLITNYTTEDEIASSIADKTISGRIARYACYADYHDILAEKLKSLCRWLESETPEALRSTARNLWYVDTGPLLERDLAQRAGAGFVGKHANLLNSKLGNWILISEIITTLEIEPDAPEKNRCGNCTRCLDACPTQAFVAPFQLDARRCISYLTIELKDSIPMEFRRAIGDRIYGCDDCLAACPWNRFAQEASLMKPHRRQSTRAGLIELLSIDEAEFRKRFAGSPMLRAKRRGLLRNVAVALGNVGDGTALAALEKAKNDPEPLIAEHAAWAEGEILTRSAGGRISA